MRHLLDLLAAALSLAIGLLNECLNIETLMSLMQIPA